LFGKGELLSRVGHGRIDASLFQSFPVDLEEGKMMLGAIVVQGVLTYGIATHASEKGGALPEPVVIIRMVSYEEATGPGNNPPFLLRLYKCGQVKGTGALSIRKFDFLFRDQKGKTVYLQVQVLDEKETTAATIASFLRELRQAVPAGVRAEVFVRLRGLSQGTGKGEKGSG